jgi:hypothetical protein
LNIGLARDSLTNKCVAAIWILVFLLFLSSTLNLSLDASAQTTFLSIEPQGSRVWGLGETFHVDMTVADVSDLYGWQLVLYYDPSLLNATVVAEGPFLSNLSSTYFLSSLDDAFNSTYGRITAACSLIGNISGAIGTGVLATVTFKTKSLGNGLLRLFQTKLGDSRGGMIPHVAVDGAVEVVRQVYDVAVTNVTSSLNEIAEGRSLGVSVTVANLGNRSEDFNVNVLANTSIVASEPVAGLAVGANRTLSLVWNTTGAITNSSYQIKAEATSVPDETDLVNNVRADGFVRITQRNHDVSVDHVVPKQTRAFVGQGVNVSVVVGNNGAYYETFDVTLFYDDATVAVKRVTDLPYGEEQTLNFVWDTAGVGSNRSYVMRATASQVSGETDTLNNTMTDGTVTVLPRDALSINITSIVPCNQIGQPVSSFAQGTMAYANVTLSSNSMYPEPLLLTINAYDSNASGMGVMSFQGPLAPEGTTFTLGFPIPNNATVGTAKLYANALTDWPSKGGVPYSPERTATFQITGR